jgi:hypothetical protein
MNLPETIYEQHAKDPQLTGKLQLYTNELRSMSSRVETISLRNNHDVCASEAGFMRQLLSQQLSSIEGLARQLDDNQRQLAQNILRNPVAISARANEYRSIQWKLVQRFERQLLRLREDFNWFCMNWA